MLIAAGDSLAVAHPPAPSGAPRRNNLSRSVLFDWEFIRENRGAEMSRQKRAAGLLQKCLKPVIVSVGRPATIHAKNNMSSGVASVLSELQTKLEKYERKAAQYEKSAEQATSGPDRAFYQGLASYCDDLAAKFRQVIAKRTDTSQAAE